MADLPYGYHLTARIGKIERNLDINREDAIYNFLTALVGRVGMNILAGPLVTAEVGDPSKNGCSGVVILYESHAAIHTYSFLNQAFVDIFSCKPYDEKTVFDVLHDFFGSFEIIEHNCVNRGLHWGHSCKKELKKWIQTR